MRIFLLKRFNSEGGLFLPSLMLLLPGLGLFSNLEYYLRPKLALVDSITCNLERLAQALNKYLRNE